ncbi:response regulator receiver domain [Pseudomonas congelans]|uniref:response regulator receiver domain n=1 Tax=Pseudomonas congelans TaxID=200452 RepID=UPI00117A9D6B|nr:response regulator receiver domain [Pseudomonas congelans]
MEVSSFALDRLAAAKEFAQTMIVVDDQASHHPTAEAVAALKAPSRASSRSSNDSSEALPSRSDILHHLDAKLLIDTALELGIICSVLCPADQGEDIIIRVVKAAERVDIVSLDWEMFNDSGRTAMQLIGGIIESDMKQSGRLRLISIYTGDRRMPHILQSIYESIQADIRGALKLTVSDTCISGVGGLRIVCLFKNHGTRISGEFSGFQVSEKELPAKLLLEFSSISEGLLSNVALATIASVRNVAHHLVSKFNGRMDGPYFHHRSSIPTAEDAEEYALDVVLSELKSVIDKDGVSRRWAGGSAIRNRIDSINEGADNLKIHYVKDGKELSSSVSRQQVKDLVVQGKKFKPLSFSTEPKPSKKQIEDGVSSIFSSSFKASSIDMYEFACLTGVRAHPRSRVFNGDVSILPSLRLGSILKKGEHEYWLCLQAACDSVRISTSTAFFFVPLEVETNKPQHVVPEFNAEGVANFTGLNLVSKAYTKSVSLVFEPVLCDVVCRVSAQRLDEGSFCFTDVSGVSYFWIADLKQRRALRVSQQLGGQLSRIGFDEFEPFRADA